MNEKFELVPVEEFEGKPHVEFADSVEATIRKFGVGLVVKLMVNWKLFGNRSIYRLYEPSWERVPEAVPKGELEGNDRAIHRHLMLQDGLLHLPTGMYYEMSGDHFIWPKGIAQIPKDPQVGKLWKKAQALRVREICNIVYPESEAGFEHRGQICILTGNRLSTRDLDTIRSNGLSLAPYVGWQVYHEMHGIGMLVQAAAPPKGESKKEFLVHWRTTCGKEGCKNRVSYYTMSGCHSGAWCYLCDEFGNYLGDLRWEYITCGRCSSGRA